MQPDILIHCPICGAGLWFRPSDSPGVAKLISWMHVCSGGQRVETFVNREIHSPAVQPVSDSKERE